jgi:hypothetical protein
MMRKYVRRLAVSGIAGFVLLAALYGFVYFTVRVYPTEGNVLVYAGMIIAFLITIPVFLHCGADCPFPPWWILLLTAAFDVIVFAVGIYALLTLLDLLRTSSRSRRH